jgi:hypothetical protein
MAFALWADDSARASMFSAEHAISAAIDSAEPSPLDLRPH